MDAIGKMYVYDMHLVQIYLVEPKVVMLITSRKIINDVIIGSVVYHTLCEIYYYHNETTKPLVVFERGYDFEWIV